MLVEGLVVGSVGLFSPSKGLCLCGVVVLVIAKRNSPTYINFFSLFNMACLY